MNEPEVSSHSPMAKSAPASDPAKSTKVRQHYHRHRRDGWRETVESVVVAFLLAFLIRAFEAEAFVIPTGSMAPTLMGQHKDVTCRECGFWYRVGHDKSMSSAGGQRTYGVCPNCRYTNDMSDLPWFKGDRILVLKFVYAFAPPQRWDVIVFHYPEEARENYIKRLIGLPGERVRIYFGDIYTQGSGDASSVAGAGAVREAGPRWRIARKEEPEKQQVLQMHVCDNDHQPRSLGGPSWQRWTADSPGSWVGEEDGRAFLSRAEGASGSGDASRAAAGPLSWLRYRHLEPRPEDWKNPAAASPAPQLITDFYAYNGWVEASARRGSSPPSVPTDRDGARWVGDLTVEFQAQLLEPSYGQLVCELVEGIGRYQCRFDLASGRASLWQQVWDLGGEKLLLEIPLGEAATSVKGSGTHRIAFANVDDRLLLWVDGALVPFADEATAYRPPYAERLALRVLADNPDLPLGAVLFPAGQDDRSAAGDGSSALRRFQHAWDALGGPPLRLIPYLPGDRLDHSLRSLDAHAAVALLGPAEQSQALLSSLGDAVRGHPLKYYAAGVEGGWDDASGSLPDVTVVHLGPTARDLSPVGIGVSGARLRVRHLLLKRDVYYVNTNGEGGHQVDNVSGDLPELLATPARWEETFAHVREQVFDLGPGQYLVLGDNSPKSADSRLWGRGLRGPDEKPYAVAEKLLIGRAYFIYWPHGVPFWPNVEVGPLRVPFRPQVERMKFIR